MNRNADSSLQNINKFFKSVGSRIAPENANSKRHATTASIENSTKNLIKPSIVPANGFGPNIYELQKKPFQPRL
jgi:hypothetical protein